MRCKNILALAIAILLWGTSYSLVKMILEVPPITIALFRVAISLLLLIPLALYKNRGLRSVFSNWKTLLALGITGIVGYQVLQNFGLVMTSASDSGVLLNTDPIFIAILSLYFLKEKISRYKAIGIAVAFAGVSVIVLRGGLSLSSNIASIVGDILALSAAFSWAIYSVHGKKVIEKINPYDIAAYSALFGFLALIPLAVGFEHITLALATTTWLILLFLGLGASGAAYLLWFVVLEESNASDAGIAIFFTPLLAVTVASLFLGEQISALFVIGTALVLFGVFLATRE
jgi:drug/metabolite transporter (DMT)-like permease